MLEGAQRSVAEFADGHNVHGFADQRMLPGQEGNIVARQCCIPVKGDGEAILIEPRQLSGQ